MEGNPSSSSKDVRRVVDATQESSSDDAEYDALASDHRTRPMIEGEKLRINLAHGFPDMPESLMPEGKAKELDKVLAEIDPGSLTNSMRIGVAPAMDGDTRLTYWGSRAG